MDTFFNKSFEALNAADISYLISQKVAERHNLEYKRQLYERNDDGTRELLKDITALANTSGGHLLIGIEEDSEGAASTIVDVPEAEAERDRILSILTASVDPRIPGLQIKTLLADNKTILLIYIPKSHRSPHLITFKGLNQFWTRHDRQKTKMSVDEIRDIFVKTENLVEDINAFISKQKKVLQDEIQGDSYFAIGALPVLRSGVEIVDIKDASVRQMLIASPDQRHGAWSFNFEGYAQARPTLNGLRTHLPNADHWKMLELYRNGYFQAKILMEERSFYREAPTIKLPDGKQARVPVIYPYPLAEYIVSYFRILKRLSEHLGIEENYMVFVSLFNIKNHGLKEYRPEAIGYQGGHVSMWPSQHLELPVMQMNLAQSADSLGKELADRIWQAFGYEQCPMFHDGNLQVTPRDTYHFPAGNNIPTRDNLSIKVENSAFPV